MPAFLLFYFSFVLENLLLNKLLRVGLKIKGDEILVGEFIDKFNFKL